MDENVSKQMPVSFGHLKLKHVSNNKLKQQLYKSFNRLSWCNMYDIND